MKILPRFLLLSTSVLRSSLQLSPMPRSSSSMSSNRSIPKALVFDLDGCVWDPEMYELWGGGGSPFTLRKDGNLTDRSGTTVHLLGDVKNLMAEFKTDPTWSDSIICVASSCDEPSWARECIQKFPVGKDHKLKLKDVFDKNHI